MFIGFSLPEASSHRAGSGQAATLGSGNVAAVAKESDGMQLGE